MLPDMLRPRRILTLSAMALTLAGCCPCNKPPPRTGPGTQPASRPALPVAGAPELELVESVPVETNWDQADVRDTQRVWLEMIGRARRTLDVAQFYFAHKEGQALAPVLAEGERTWGRLDGPAAVLIAARLGDEEGGR